MLRPRAANCTRELGVGRLAPSRRADSQRRRAKSPGRFHNGRESISQYKIVPTQAQRNGDFSGLKDSKGTPITLKDPLGVGIANNQVPKSLLSPQTLAFLQFEPLPN